MLIYKTLENFFIIYSLTQIYLVYKKAPLCYTYKEIHTMGFMMKSILKTLKSTDCNSILIKLTVFYIFMALSLININFSIIALFVICVYALIEFSYNSIIWLILYISAQPYSPPLLLIISLFIFVLILLIKLVINITQNKLFIKTKQNICIFLIWGLILILFLIPFATHYNFLLALIEVVAVSILVIIFINYNQLNIPMLLKIFAIFIAVFCLTHNILGTLNLCYYRIILYNGLNRYSLFVNDPNYTASVVLIAIASINILNKNKQIKSWLYYTLSVILGVIVINTISKAGFIVYALMLIVIMLRHIILITKTKSKEATKDLLLFLASIALIYLLSFNAFNASVTRFFTFTNSAPEDMVSELTTERSDIYLIYLKECFSSPYKFLFGHGSGAPPLEFGTRDLRDTHCIALSMLYKYGLLISLLLIVLFIISFIKTKQKLDWFNICCSGLILLIYMSLSIFLFSHIYIFLFIFFVACGIKDKSIFNTKLKE